MSLIDVDWWSQHKHVCPLTPVQVKLWLFMFMKCGDSYLYHPENCQQTDNRCHEAVTHQLSHLWSELRSWVSWPGRLAGGNPRQTESASWWGRGQTLAQCHHNPHTHWETCCSAAVYRPCHCMLGDITASDFHTAATRTDHDQMRVSLWHWRLCLQLTAAGDSADRNSADWGELPSLRFSADLAGAMYSVWAMNHTLAWDRLWSGLVPW